MSDPQRGQGELPVLTEVLEAEPSGLGRLDADALEALARELERSLLARLSPQLERLVAEAVREALAPLGRN